MKTTTLTLAAAGMAVFGIGAAPAAAQQAAPAVAADEAMPEAAPTQLPSTRAISLGSRGSSSTAADLRDWKQISSELTEVQSSEDGGLFRLFLDEKGERLLAELPAGFDRKDFFVATTVASGATYAGLQAGDRYVRLAQIGDRLALIEPELGIRAKDPLVKASVERLFTDRVLADVAIIGKGPSGRPVVSLNDLLLGNARLFFGGDASGINGRLTTVSKAKSFPENIEVAFTAPAAGGVLRTFYYSLSVIQGTPGYKPRLADARVGYFVTSYRDLSQIDRDEVAVRYINRWHLEKADPSLELSPPKEPIIYYVEHTVPVAYRRWVRHGAEMWNKAFRAVGIEGAVEIRFQDKATGTYMDLDPEDVRYNFIRWLSNDQGTAIGPSRVNPMTGEILDADVILTDGFLRSYNFYWADLLPQIAMEGFGPATMAWLDENPEYDPRVLLAPPAERPSIIDQRRRRGVVPLGGHIAAGPVTEQLGDEPLDGLVGRTSQVNGMCQAAGMMNLETATARLWFAALALALDDEAADAAAESGEEVVEKQVEEEQVDLTPFTPEVIAKLRRQVSENPDLLDLIDPSLREALTDEHAGKELVQRIREGTMIDGLPELFAGPMLADLVAHEVGHTLGLRHNFKASSYYPLEEINSLRVAGSRPMVTSVMDYTPVNIRVGDFGEMQGDFAVTDIGPYDMWAIEYGYGFGDPEKVAERSAEPALQYATDENTWGPDPYAARWDLSADPLEFAANQVAIADLLRSKILDGFVEDGQSWARARYAWRVALSQHTRAVSTAARWVGGAHVYRDRKGTPGARVPVEPVAVETQRRALDFVVENTFRDEAFGLSPELLRHLALDKWWDTSTTQDQEAYDVHDQILGVQGSAMTMILNPTTLQRVLDNEMFTPADEDMLTLPELLGTVTEAAWTEIYEGVDGGPFTDRQPMISSLRRNLQREHLSRMISLVARDARFNAAGRQIATLAAHRLEDLHTHIADALDGGGLDAYTQAHLANAKLRIEQALEAGMVYTGL